MFLQNNYQTAANEFRGSLNGDQEPQWTEVWSHISLGKNTSGSFARFHSAFATHQRRFAPN